MDKKRKKIRVAVIFGGKSAEHEVSLQSAKNVIDAMDKNKYEITMIGVDKSGRWHKNDSNFLLNASNPKLIKLNSKDSTTVVPVTDNSSQLVALNSGQTSTIDVAFPILHGPYGEDGTVQGLLKLAGIPFVGASVLGSAVGMDKDVMKRLFQEGKLRTPRFIVLQQTDSPNFYDIRKKLGKTLFVKPANMGSSVGVSKVKGESEFHVALRKAFKFDTKLLVEECIKGREIECAVLGNDKPIASIPGEVLPMHDFYSYEAKYIDENGAVLEIPAKLTRSKIKEVQATAIKVFKTLCLEGMARIDFFLTKDGKLYVNEANTIPGFTRISMYPKLWEASGIPYPSLIDKLISLAIERFNKESKLKTRYI